MMHKVLANRTKRIAVLCLLCIALSGCFFVPGRFNSKLDIAKDGSFFFSYTGELVFLMPEERLQDWDDAMARCYDDSGDGMDARPCTDAETAEEKARFDAQNGESEEAGKYISELVGFNPISPESNRALAKELERHPGWKKVQYVGPGRFYVEYEMRGQLDRDFAFPLIPQAQMAMPFVHIARAEGNTVKVRGGGFASPQLRSLLNGSNPDADSDERKAMAAQFGDLARGTFIVTTTARINSTNGAEDADGDSKRLTWVLDGQGRETPMVDLELNR